jgi:alpha-tubulin suppressor-like RCC1 family protein
MLLSIQRASDIGGKQFAFHSCATSSFPGSKFAGCRAELASRLQGAMKNSKFRPIHFIGLITTGFSLVGTLSMIAGGRVVGWGDNSYGQARTPDGLRYVKALAAAATHNLALRTDGTVVAWGGNSPSLTNIPSGLNNVTAVTASDGHNLALKDDGTVVAWGDGAYGRTNVPPGLSKVIALAAGQTYSMVLKSDGKVVAWGNSMATNVPLELKHVVAIAAGGEHGLGLKADGTVIAWGANNSGQTAVPEGLSGVVDISTRGSTSVALKRDGTVVTWGANVFGQADVPSGLSNVVAISSGAYHTLALKVDGTVVAWGRNDYGQTNRVPGLTNVTAIAAGGLHNLALVMDGPIQITSQPGNQTVMLGTALTLSVTATGRDGLSCQWLGNNVPLTNSDRVSGADTMSLTLSDVRYDNPINYVAVVTDGFAIARSTGAVVQVVGPPTISQQPLGQTVGAGSSLAMMVSARGTEPLSYQWLRDGTPLIGSRSYNISLSNVQPSQSGSYSVIVSNTYGVAVSSNALVTVTNARPSILSQPMAQSVAIGTPVKFSVVARGSLPLSWQWRHNGEDIPGATNASLSLSFASPEQAGFYAVVIRNDFGEAVSAKVYLSVAPIAIWGSGILGSFTNIPVGLSNAVAITAGSFHLLALKPDGTVVAWGGIDPRRPSGWNPGLTNVPPGLTNVTAIAAGDTHNLALKADGTVVEWGAEKYGPPYLPRDLSNVVAVAAGELHSLALRKDGHVVAWGTRLGSTRPGYNPYSGLTNVPPGLSNVIGIAAGANHSLALKSDGTVISWGLSATNVPAGLSNIIAVVCGQPSIDFGFSVWTNNINLALRSDGTVVSWGTSLPRTPAPTISVMPGVTNAVAIDSDSYRMALKSDGQVALWELPSGVPSYWSNVFAIACSLASSGDIWLPDYPITGKSALFFALVGDGSPHITLQPASQTMSRGGMVQLHTRAVGTPPLRYQWQFEGGDIPAATNATFIIPAATVANAGNYRAVVTNARGKVVSLSAELRAPDPGTLAAALNATNLLWTTSATNSAWFPQSVESHDGEASAQSGPIGHKQQATLRTTITGPGSLTFWWRTSSEEWFDSMSCFVDSYSAPRAAISGETGWEYVAIPIPVGTHGIWWTYSKDTNVSVGQDAAWVDQVMFTPSNAAPAGTSIRLGTPTWEADGGVRMSARISDANGSLSPGDLSQWEAQGSTNLLDWETLSEAWESNNGSLYLREPRGGLIGPRFYRLIRR